VSLTIVIVADHAGFRAFARALLEADGFTVLAEAQDGASAIEACERLDPDVVLVDIVLPGRDGFALSAQLAQGSARPAVVLTSSRPATAYARQLQTTTARGFLPKEDLSGSAIRSVLEARP